MRSSNLAGRPVSGGKILLTSTLLLALLHMGKVAAETVTLTPVKDNTLYETANGDLSNGAGTAMFAGRSAQTVDSIRRALLAFDVADAIPAGSAIGSVTLTLHNSAANTEDETLSLHRLSSDWGEGASATSGGGGSGRPAALGDATWLHTFHDTAFWTLPGGDFDLALSAAAPVGGPGSYEWGSTTQLVADVQLFLDEPTRNFGWILLGNETEPGTAKKFATREEPNAVLQPRLAVSYTPVPEPGTFVLLGVGAICVCMRGLTQSVIGDATSFQERSDKCPRALHEPRMFPPSVD